MSQRILFPAFLSSLCLEAYFLKDVLTQSGHGLPNSDDLTRIAEVRDLMNGQGWFDLMQYRLGVAPGIEMHWSRLVDAPIAALIWLGNVFAPGHGELAAGYIWPFMTIVMAMAALLYGFRKLMPDAPLLPACVIGACSLIAGGIFIPQAFDHHNIQSALALWLIALLVPGHASGRDHALAGTVAAVMLAIGIETLPYVVMGAAFVSFQLLADNDAAKPARAFGLALVLSIVMLFFALIGPSRYLNNACDAFSSFQLVMAASGGLCLALLAHLCLSPRTFRFRFAGLLSIAVFAGLLLIVFFPHCLANPLAALDPRLKKFWLDGVIEAQGAAVLYRRDPFMLPGLFGLPLSALLVSLYAAARNIERRAHGLFALMLAAALLVTSWQMRGSTFALPFAALPLSLWIARMSAGAQNGPASKSAVLIGAWVLSISLFWGLSGSMAAKFFSRGPTLTEQAAASSPRDLCFDEDLFAPLSSEPAGTVLGATNLGAPVLKYTGMRTLTGAYHRNAAGNLALIDVMTGLPDMAKAIMQREKVTILAVCVKGADEADFIAAAPGGFLNQLMSGARFDWLEPVDGSIANPLRFWRVKI